MPDKFVYLASQSPRRAELLRQLGVDFEIMRVEVDETPRAGETVENYVTRLARAKAEAALLKLGGKAARPVLAADTAVAADGRILGKPRNKNAALVMLAQLSGRTHRVLSAVALWSAGTLQATLSVSQVRLRIIHPAEAAAYWDSGEPADKAGAYAIQGRGAMFVERLEGSYSGVMGLPLFETAQLLRAAGVKILLPKR